MIEWMCNYWLKKASRRFQVETARRLLEEIQDSTDYSITDDQAEKILEAVVKSIGNKVVDFVLKD